MMTGFMVESIPSGCDQIKSKEKCLFNEYMNSTGIHILQKEFRLKE